MSGLSAQSLPPQSTSPYPASIMSRGSSNYKLRPAMPIIPGRAEFVVGKLSGHGFSCPHFPKIRTAEWDYPSRLGFFYTRREDICYIDLDKLCFTCSEQVIPGFPSPTAYNVWTSNTPDPNHRLRLKRKPTISKSDSSKSLIFVEAGSERYWNPEAASAKNCPQKRVPAGFFTPPFIFTFQDDLQTSQAWDWLRESGAPFYVKELHSMKRLTPWTAKVAKKDAEITSDHGTHNPLALESGPAGTMNSDARSVTLRNSWSQGLENGETIPLYSKVRATNCTAILDVTSDDMGNKRSIRPFKEISSRGNPHPFETLLDVRDLQENANLINNKRQGSEDVTVSRECYDQALIGDLSIKSLESPTVLTFEKEHGRDKPRKSDTHLIGMLSRKTAQCQNNRSNCDPVSTKASTSAGKRKMIGIYGRHTTIPFDCSFDTAQSILTKLPTPPIQNRKHPIFVILSRVLAPVGHLPRFIRYLPKRVQTDSIVPVPAKQNFRDRELVLDKNSTGLQKPRQAQLLPGLRSYGSVAFPNDHQPESLHLSSSRVRKPTFLSSETRRHAHVSQPTMGFNDKTTHHISNISGKRTDAHLAKSKKVSTREQPSVHSLTSRRRHGKMREDSNGSNLKDRGAMSPRRRQLKNRPPVLPSSRGPGEDYSNNTLTKSYTSDMAESSLDDSFSDSDYASSLMKDDCNSPSYPPNFIEEMNISGPQYDEEGGYVVSNSTCDEAPDSRQDESEQDSLGGRNESGNEWSREESADGSKYDESGIGEVYEASDENRDNLGSDGREEMSEMEHEDDWGEVEGEEE